MSIKPKNAQIQAPVWHRYMDAMVVVEKLIKAALTAPEQINEYVPNTHVAEKFLEMVDLLEFEMIFFPPLTKRRRILDEFAGYHENLTLHEIYQKLRVKDDYYRNIYKLIIIRYEKSWNLYRQNKNTISAKLEKRIKKVKNNA